MCPSPTASPCRTLSTVGLETVRGRGRERVLLDSAETLGDLAALPSNRLEALRGDRAGQHSIRINAQWRVCFRRTDDGPHDVEIVDYH